MENFEPGYLDLLKSGELADRAREALSHLERCTLCARCCHVNRLLSPTRAACRTGEKAVVFSYGPHHGEERPLVGRFGSGTIFFSWCNLDCVFCQNWDISHRGEGREVSTGKLAAMMLELQERGCHNINFVTPSHVIPQILSALVQAAEEGLRLPLVYNSGGYDSLEALGLLDGIIDIYMPDMKFADSRTAAPYLGVSDYAEVNRAAVKEMHHQVGDLAVDERVVAQSGLLIRHLVLPDNLAGTDRILEFISREISPETYLNLMEQYRPCYRAEEYPPLGRRPSRSDFQRARKEAARLGLRRLDLP